MKYNIISFVIGLAAGVFGGLVGLGGGLIMIPLMVGILKVSQHRAHGTSLVALVFTGLSGAVSYALNGSIDLTRRDLSCGYGHAHRPLRSSLMPCASRMEIKEIFWRILDFMRHSLNFKTVDQQIRRSDAVLFLNRGVFNNRSFYRISFRHDGSRWRYDHGSGHGTALWFQPASSPGNITFSHGSGRCCWRFHAFAVG